MRQAPPTLRPYQTEIIEELRTAFRMGYHAPLLQLATAGGKTVIFAAIIASALERGTRVLVVAHRRELIRQASAKLAAAGVPHGIIASGYPETPHAIQVGSIQTLVRRLDRLPDFGLIVLDEAHHAVTKQWRTLLNAQARAFILGVTATPVRLDGRGLGTKAGGIFDVLIQGPSIAKLTRDGFLSAARYFVPECKLDTSGVRQVRGDFCPADLEKMMMSGDVRIIGDAVDSYRRHADHRPAICFVVTIRHGECVARQFREAGYRAACVHGGLSVRQRDALIAGLGTGEIEVLVSCELINEGLDVPAVAAVILLRLTQSVGLHLQQIGRGLRPAPGKNYLIVLDHVGNVFVHGRADDDRAWTLDGGPASEQAKGKPKIKRCEACKAANRIVARICENCGAAFPVSDRNFDPAPGHLVEISPERIDFLAHVRYQQLNDMVLSEAEARATAHARGYKSGWVAFFLAEQATRQSIKARQR